MLTKEAIEALSEAQSIGAAAQAVRNGMGDAVALPNCYTMHDLERFAAVRRRARGKMTTEALADFSAYVQAHAEAGATVFVNGATMAATAVLNLGTPQDPGHADNTAVYAPPKTAAYKALLATASGAGMPQQKAAEFFEDWLAIAALEFLIGDDPVPPPKAIAAVRAITIEAAAAYVLEILPGEFEGTWKQAMAWAKKQGGELPTRKEQALLFANASGKFESGKIELENAAGI